MSERLSPGPEDIGSGIISKEDRSSQEGAVEEKVGGHETAEEALRLPKGVAVESLPDLDCDENSPPQIGVEAAQRLVREFEVAAGRGLNEDGEEVRFVRAKVLPPDDRHSNPRIIFQQRIGSLEAFYLIDGVERVAPNALEYSVREVAYRLNGSRFHRTSEWDPDPWADLRLVVPAKGMLPQEPAYRPGPFGEGTVLFGVPVKKEVFLFDLGHEYGHAQKGKTERQLSEEERELRTRGRPFHHFKALTPRQMERGYRKIVASERGASARALLAVRKQKRPGSVGAREPLEEGLESYERSLSLENQPSVEHAAANEARRLVRFWGDIRLLCELKGENPNASVITLKVSGGEVFVRRGMDNLEFSYAKGEFPSEGEKTFTRFKDGTSTFRDSRGGKHLEVNGREDDLAEEDARFLEEEWKSLEEGIREEGRRLVDQVIEEGGQEIMQAVAPVLNWRLSEGDADVEEADLVAGGTSYLFTRMKESPALLSVRQRIPDGEEKMFVFYTKGFKGEGDSFETYPYAEVVSKRNYVVGSPRSNPHRMGKLEDGGVRGQYEVALEVARLARKLREDLRA
jgi:hypothetical protein